MTLRRLMLVGGIAVAMAIVIATAMRIRPGPVECRRPPSERRRRTWEFEIEFQPEAPPRPPPPGAPPPPPLDPDAPSLFTAIEEQLGLKLEATKGPVEVWVVDSVERPMLTVRTDGRPPASSA